MWNTRILSDFVQSETGDAPNADQRHADLSPTFVRQRLQAGLTGRSQVTIVHGPPGTGKSVLLSHWVERIRAAGHVVIALDADRTRDENPVGFWDSAAAAATRQGWTIDESQPDKREAIKQSLARSAGNLYLVVDNVVDVDRYVNSTEIEELLAASPRFRTVIASRAQGSPEANAAFIGPERLLFTAKETQQCLTHRGVDISTALFHEVMVVLRGWPGLVDIVAESVAGAADRDALDAAMQNAFEHLARVLREDPQDLPITPFLRSTLPGVCLIRALKDSDWDQALDILSRDWVRLSSLHTSLMFSALHVIPREAMAAHRDADMVRRLLTSRHPGPADEIPLPADPAELIALLEQDHGRVALVRAYTAVAWFRRGAIFSRLDEVCDRALVILEEARHRSVPETSVDLAIGYLHIGAAHMLTGDFDRAEHELKFAVQFADRQSLHFLVAASAGSLGLLYSVQGRIAESRHLIGLESRQTVVGPTSRILRTAGRTARLINAIESLDRDAAFEAFEAIDDPLSELETWPFILYAMCLWHRVFGDPHAILDLVHRLRRTEWHDVPDGSISDDMVAAAESWSLLRLGQVELALKAIDPIDGPVADAMRIRIQIASGDYEQAVHTTDLVTKANSPALRVERLLLSFEGNDAIRNRGAATTALRHSLAVSQMAGNFSEYLSLPTQLLASYVADVPGIEAVISAIETSGFIHEKAPTLATTDLSKRELEVLRSLALRPTYAKVAEHLFVSISTVKTHVASIHKKLGTRERADLMRLAATMGMLDSSDDIDS